MKSKIFLIFSLLFIFALTVAAQEKPKSEMMQKNEMMQKVTSKTEPLQIGETAPDFTLSDQNGKQITLSEAKMPVVLVFYRGYWCPFCGRQLADLRSLLKPDEKVALYAVSIDPAEKSLGLMKKIAKDEKGEVNYSLLSDPNHQTIDAYGVFDPTYIGEKFEGIPHPAVFILDKNRKIMWTKVESDYKKRPTNDEIRAELNKLK